MIVNKSIDTPEQWDTYEPEHKRLLVFNALHATPDEKRLIDKVGGFEPLFGDMLFLPGTCTGALRILENVTRTGDFEDRESKPICRLLREFSYMDFSYKVCQPEEMENKEWEAYFNPILETLYVRADQLDSDDTILHELIHLYEYAYEFKKRPIQHPEESIERKIEDVVEEEVEVFVAEQNALLRYRDMLFWALYQQVHNRIPQLDEIVLLHAHLWTQDEITAQGGKHDILFLLKSLDLDMRMGYPLGKVFGYGREDDYKCYSYTPYESE